MRYHDDQTIFRDFFEDLHDLQAGLGIQRTCRFVCQNDIRIIHDGLGDRNSLHLSAGHFTGFFLELIAKSYFFQRFLGPLASFCLGDAGKCQGQFHVL